MLGHTEHFISMEFIQGTLLADSLEYGDISLLLAWAQEHLWMKNIQRNPQFQKDSYDFYFTKTEKRLVQLDLSDECMTVNGVDVGSATHLLNEIPSSFLVTDLFSQFHGDFILDNIIKTEKHSFVLLDWRHEFGQQLDCGDIYSTAANP